MRHQKTRDTYVKRRSFLLPTCVLVVFLVAMTITIANVSLPHIQGSLSATREQVAWVVTSYLVANAVGLPATGWLTDRFGARALIVWGTIIFSFTTLLCAISPNLMVLVFWRAVQGLLSAPLTPLCMAMVLAAYPRDRHGMVTAIFGLGVTIGPIIAPWLGGVLTEAYGWRSVFYFCLPFAGIACLAVYFVIPKDRPTRKRKLDLKGLIFLSLAIAAFQLMIDRGERNDWFESTETYLECFVGIFCLYLFIVHSFTWLQPYIDLRILANRDLSIGLTLVAIFGMLSYSPTVLLPNMLQDLRGYPVELIGVLVAIRGSGMFIGFVILIWGSRLDPRIWLTLGFTLQVLSGGAMAHFDINVTNFQMAWTGFISGLGIGFLWIPLTVVTLSPLSQAQLPIASSIFHLVRLFGSSIHISLSVALAIRSGKLSIVEIMERLQPGRPAFSVMEIQALGLNETLPIVNEINRQAEMIGYINAYFFFAVTALAALPLILLVRLKRE